jgi:acyl carrier protein
MTIESTVKAIVVESLMLPEDLARSLSVDTRLFGAGEDSLDLDSLASLEILAGLTERFDLPFDDVEAKDFRSIGTLAAYVRKCGVGDVG